MRSRQLDNSMSSVGPYTALVIRARWHQGDLSLVRVPWNSSDPISTARASAVEIGSDCLSPPSSYTQGQFSLFSSTLYHGDFLGSGRPTSASARHQPRIPVLPSLYPSSPSSQRRDNSGTPGVDAEESVQWSEEGPFVLKRSYHENLFDEPFLKAEHVYSA